MTSREKKPKEHKKLRESATPYAPIDTVLLGDSWTIARSLPSNYVQCVVTSPPYFGHREYSDNEELAQMELGREEEPAAYVRRLVFPV